MMFKRLAICLVLVGTPHVAAAQSVQDQIVAQLRGQGFSEISLNRTWLGRVRVTAVRDDLRRELVFNPQTGEILRDYWRTTEADDDDGPRLFNPGGGATGGDDAGNGNDGPGNDDEGPGEDGEDHDDDDQDEDDDEDDDDDDDDEDDDDEDDDDEDDDDDDDE
jgi:hypothetical protein